VKINRPLLISIFLNLALIGWIISLRVAHPRQMTSSATTNPTAKTPAPAEPSKAAHDFPPRFVAFGALPVLLLLQQMMFHPRTAQPRANEGPAANRHLPLASAERRDCLCIGLACHAQRRVPAAELGRSAPAALLFCRNVARRPSRLAQIYSV